MKKQDSISEDDKVFILRGDDLDEIYIVDDPATITKLDGIIDDLKGMDETEISRYLLSVVNPGKYKMPQRGKR